MYNTKKIKNCMNFKAIDQDMSGFHHKHSISNCKNCAYFSSRNCGMDVADSIEPTIDSFS